jgi:hypothetical protein
MFFKNILLQIFNLFHLQKQSLFCIIIVYKFDVHIMLIIIIFNVLVYTE